MLMGVNWMIYLHFNRELSLLQKEWVMVDSRYSGTGGLGFLLLLGGLLRHFSDCPGRGHLLSLYTGLALQHIVVCLQKMPKASRTLLGASLLWGLQKHKEPISSNLPASSLRFEPHQLKRPDELCSSLGDQTWGPEKSLVWKDYFC